MRMSNITENLKKILSAVRGKDVRQAIHDSIHDCYEDGKVGATDLLARERIDNLAKLPSGSTSGDAELVDIRVDRNGKTHPNAGEAVRQQINEIDQKYETETSSLKQDIGEITYYKKKFKWKKGYIKTGILISNKIDITPIESDNYGHIILQVNKNDKFILTCFAGDKPRGWAFTSDDYSLIIKAEEQQIDNQTLIAPTNGYIICNANLNRDHVLYALIKNNITEKIKSIYDVKSFGAIGDGITDDTEAIKNAILSCDGNTLFFSNGTYLISETLTIPSGTKIMGNGEKTRLILRSEYSLTPYSWRSETKNSNDKERYPVIETENESNGCIIENISINARHGSFKDNNEDAISIRGKNHIVRNVIVENINYYPNLFGNRKCLTPGMGIYIINADNILISNCELKKCGYEGIGTENAHNITIKNCNVGDCNQTGIQIHRNSHAITVDSCYIKYTDALANCSFTMDADPLTPMSDIHITNNYFAHNINMVAGGENDIFITNNYVEKGFSCNNNMHRNKLFMSSNYFNGRVNTCSDNAIINNNIINVSTGYYMIIACGDNVLVTNNLGEGSVKDITIKQH